MIAEIPKLDHEKLEEEDCSCNRWSKFRGAGGGSYVYDYGNGCGCDETGDTRGNGDNYRITVSIHCFKSAI